MLVLLTADLFNQTQFQLKTFMKFGEKNQLLQVQPLKMDPLKEYGKWPGNIR